MNADPGNGGKLYIGSAEQELMEDIENTGESQCRVIYLPIRWADASLVRRTKDETYRWKVNVHIQLSKTYNVWLYFIKRQWVPVFVYACMYAPTYVCRPTHVFVIKVM